MKVYILIETTHIEGELVIHPQTYSRLDLAQADMKKAYSEEYLMSENDFSEAEFDRTEARLGDKYYNTWHWKIVEMELDKPWFS